MSSFVAEIKKRGSRIQLYLDGDERAALHDVMQRLDQHVQLLPSKIAHAYEDEQLQAEFDDFVTPQVASEMNADLDVIRDCLESGEDVTTLTDAQALCWLRGLNHLRLAAGDALGIHEDGWEQTVSKQQQRSAEFRILVALGYIQEELVAVLES